MAFKVCSVKLLTFVGAAWRFLPIRIFQRGKNEVIWVSTIISKWVAVKLCLYLGSDSRLLLNDQHSLRKYFRQRSLDAPHQTLIKPAHQGARSMSNFHLIFFSDNLGLVSVYNSPALFKLFLCTFKSFRIVWPNNAAHSSHLSLIHIWRCRRS